MGICLPSDDMTKAWFIADDVSRLAAATGLPLLPNVKQGIVANSLDEAFRSASFLGRHPPSFHQEKEQLSDILKTAKQLLTALGYPTQRLPLPKPSSKRIISQISEIHNSLMVRFHDGGHRPGSERWYSKHLQSYVDEAREAVSTILWAAHVAKQTIPKDPSKAGRRSSLGLDAFYCKLAPAFASMFGTRPSLSGQLPADADSGVLWSQAIVQTLHNRRLGRELTEDDEQLLLALATIRSSSAHGKRLRQGWKAWIALPSEDRWPPHIWMDMETGAPVPEWVPKSAIPAP